MLKSSRCARVVVALGAISAMEAIGVVEASAIFAAVKDAIAAVAVDAITAGDDVVVVVVADAIFTGRGHSSLWK